MCWVSRLSKNDIRLFFFSLINLFRCCVHSANSSERHWFGSQRLSQGRRVAWKPHGTQQLCQERKAGYWLYQSCGALWRWMTGAWEVLICWVGAHVLEGSMCHYEGIVTWCRGVASKVNSWRNALGRDGRACFPNLEPTHISWVLTLTLNLNIKFWKKASFLIQNKMLSKETWEVSWNSMISLKRVCLRI